MSQTEPRIRQICHCTETSGNFAAAGTAWLLCAVLLLTTSCDSPIAPEVNLPERAEAQYTEDGTEGCLRCHGADRMTLIAATPHGDTNNPYAPFALQGCESCHGPASLHVSRARGGTGFPALLQFGDRKTRNEQTAACLDCHVKDMGDAEGMQWAGSLHDTPRITCVTCHVVHVEEDPMTDQSKQTAKCARCHQDEIASHKRFKRKGILFEKLSCYACHDVHQLSPADPKPAADN